MVICMLRSVAAVAALSVGLLWVGTARAQTPFGGDDTGLVPPAADAKCEAGAGKAVDKLIACILKCHASRASGKLADDTAEDSCEKTLVGKSCAAKFTLAISKLKGCPACINGTTMGNLAGTTESLLDGNNSTVYCDTSSGTPFGGDDTGDIPPPNSASAKCEAGAAKAEGKLIACIDKCHASRASGKLADDTAEDSCEKTLAGSSCAAKFTASIAKLSNCPACINGTTMATLAGTIESFLDGNNSTVYCDTSSGTPFGGDDTGDIPTPKSASAKCEAGAAKAAGKLIACIDKCHESRLSGKLADDTAEDSCEKTLAGKSCTAKFAGSIAKLSGCPMCINGTTMGNLAGTIEGLLDGVNSTFACSASPSGAFVQ